MGKLFVRLILKLGIVKPVAHLTNDNIIRYRMKKLGIRFKDIARKLNMSEPAIIMAVNNNDIKVISKIKKYLKNIEYKR